MTAKKDAADAAYAARSSTLAECADLVRAAIPWSVLRAALAATTTTERPVSSTGPGSKK
jgi:hypothetical protein